MINRVAVKREAKELMRTAKPSPFTAVLVVTAISSLATLAGVLLSLNQAEGSVTATFITVLATLFGWLLMAGMTSFMLATHRRQIASNAMLMDGFGMAGKIIWLNVRISVQTALWSSLFLVPGIIAFYRYSFALYILLDDPTLTASQALRLSCIKTRGWKMDLFTLELSFLGWGLLCIAVPGVVTGLLLMLLHLPDISGYILALAVALVPTSWLQAYVALAQVGYYRTAVPDSPAETAAPSGSQEPWEN